MIGDARWARVRELFERAFDERPDDVATWLDRQGVDDWQIREEVLSLVRHHASAGSFLARAAGDQLPRLMADDRSLERRAIVRVVYDTEHLVTFSRHSSRLATSRSIATRIAESGGGDRGFLWRLNSYWRYTQEGHHVRIDVESISLSRHVPRVLRPVAAPIVIRVARESLVRTLDAVRT